FPELEAAAEDVARKAKLDRTDLYSSMLGYLRHEHGITVVLTPVGRNGSTVRRYDPDRKLLELSEVLPPWSRHFQLAHQIGLLAAQPVIDAIIARSQSHLTTPDSIKLCRIALANCFAAAFLMPYDEFLRFAEEV